MQFALLVYESPKAFAARNTDENDPYTGAWRAYYKTLLEAGIYVGGNPLGAPETGTTVRLKDGKWRVQDGPIADTKEQLGDSLFWNWPRSTQPSIGRRVAQRPRSAPSKSVRLHLNSRAGSRDESDLSRRYSSGHRACGPRVLRSPGGLSFLKHARRSQRGGRPQQRVGCGTHDLATRWRAAKSRGLAADGGAPLLYRSCAPSASSRGERAHSQAPQGGFHGDDLSAEFPDERLKLLFVCAHPAIDPAMHTPLMLQTVLALMPRVSPMPS